MKVKKLRVKINLKERKNKMKGFAAKATRALNIGSNVNASDNSGARIVRIVSVKGGKTRRGRQQYAKIGDWVKVSVRKGDPKMKGEVFDAVVIRVKKPYKRNTGERVMFIDNAVALLKDEKGNPKGTQIKGPIAKEAGERWPFVNKIARFVL
jgi:large subunit ribosomal protein L14